MKNDLEEYEKRINDINDSWLTEINRPLQPLKKTVWQQEEPKKRTVKK